MGVFENRQADGRARARACASSDLHDDHDLGGQITAGAGRASARFAADATSALDGLAFAIPLITVLAAVLALLGSGRGSTSTDETAAPPPRGLALLRRCSPVAAPTSDHASEPDPRDRFADSDAPLPSSTPPNID